MPPSFQIKCVGTHYAQRLAAAGGQLNESGARIHRVGNARHVAVAFQCPNRLGYRLSAHPETISQIRRVQRSGGQRHQHRRLRRPDPVEARCRERRSQARSPGRRHQLHQGRNGGFPLGIPTRRMVTSVPLAARLTSYLSNIGAAATMGPWVSMGSGVRNVSRRSTGGPCRRVPWWRSCIGHARRPGPIPVGDSTQTVEWGGARVTFHLYRPQGLTGPASTGGDAARRLWHRRSS